MLTGDVFVEEGLITQHQLDLAVSKQVEMGGNDPIARVMVEMGLITERDRVRCLGKVWEIPFLDLGDITPQDEALARLSPTNAHRFKSIPLSLEDGKLSIAMANPLDVFAIDELRMITQLEIQPYIVIDTDITMGLELYYKVDVMTSDAMEGIMKDFSGTFEEARTSSGDDSLDGEAGMDDAPIIRLAHLIVAQAVTEGASDIHLEPRKTEMLVRFRIDGIMVEAMRLPRKLVAALTSRFKIVANMDIAEKRAPQDNRISAVLNGREFDFRVSTLPVVYGEKIVMRVLDKGGINVGLSKLGFLPHNLRILEDMAARTFGICLVTGPTGSGKSTTLYSMLNQANDGLRNIITIEDPVEYELEGINQCHVNAKAGMTFAAGLRAMLRQDPDVIMVGEMRDRETATIAMEAALTGHLVFSTLHTNDACSAPNRLVDMEVEPFLIASSLIGVLAQRLVRVICPFCKEEYAGSRDSLLRAGFNLPDELGAETGGELTLFRGRGCDRCKGTGYKGRSGIHELLVMTDEVRDEILKKSPSHIIQRLAVQAGMRVLSTDALQKILMGVTSVDEIVRVIYA